MTASKPLKNTREILKQKMQEDGVELILTQFVDIHGAAKV